MKLIKTFLGEWDMCFSKGNIRIYLNCLCFCIFSPNKAIKLAKSLLMKSVSILYKLIDHYEKRYFEFDPLLPLKY